MDYYLSYKHDSIIWAFQEGGIEWFTLKDLRSALNVQMPIMFNADTVKRVECTTYVNKVGVERMLRALKDAGRDVSDFEAWFEQLT